MEASMSLEVVTVIPEHFSDMRGQGNLWHYWFKIKGCVWDLKFLVSKSCPVHSPKSSKRQAEGSFGASYWITVTPIVSFWLGVMAIGITEDYLQRVIFHFNFLIKGPYWFILSFQKKLSSDSYPDLSKCLSLWFAELWTNSVGLLSLVV